MMWPDLFLPRVRRFMEIIQTCRKWKVQVPYFPYAVTKMALEDYARVFYQIHGFKISVSIFQYLWA